MAEFKVSYDPPKGKPLGTNLTFKISTTLIIPIFRLIMKRDIRGVENIPASGRAIVASNHLSYADVLVLTDMLYTCGIVTGKQIGRAHV